jgi:hypothetical protein
MHVIHAEQSAQTAGLPLAAGLSLDDAAPRVGDVG